MRHSAEGLSQGILREKGTQLQEGRRCPQGKAFLPPQKQSVPWHKPGEVKLEGTESGRVKLTRTTTALRGYSRHIF